MHGEAASQIKLLEEHQILHKLAHAAAGCAAAAAQSQACRDGAIGAAVGEIVAQMIPYPESELDADWTAFEHNSKGFGTLVAGAVTAYAGGDSQTAINAASTAIDENRLGYRAVAREQGISLGQLYLNMRALRLREAITNSGGLVSANARLCCINQLQVELD